VDGSTRSDEARQESVQCSDGPIITSDQKVLWFSSIVGKSISSGEIAVNLETVKFRYFKLGKPEKQNVPILSFFICEKFRCIDLVDLLYKKSKFPNCSTQNLILEILYDDGAIVTSYTRYS